MLSSSLALKMQGGGSPELRTVDFPSAEGCLPFQGLRGGDAAARRRNVFVVFHGIEAQKDPIVILCFVLVCSVRTVF
jgi:hypothetical protein